MVAYYLESLIFVCIYYFLHLSLNAHFEWVHYDGFLLLYEIDVALMPSWLKVSSKIRKLDLL